MMDWNVNVVRVVVAPVLGGGSRNGDQGQNGCGKEWSRHKASLRSIIIERPHLQAWYSLSLAFHAHILSMKGIANFF